MHALERIRRARPPAPRSTSSAEDSGASARGAAVAGVTIVSVRPFVASAGSPSMKF